MNISRIRTANCGILRYNGSGTAEFPLYNNVSRNKNSQFELSSFPVDNYLSSYVNTNFNKQVNFTGGVPVIPQSTMEEFSDFIEPVYEQLKNEMPNFARQTAIKSNSKKAYNYLKQFDGKFKLLGVGTKSICYSIPAEDGSLCAIKLLKPDAAKYGAHSYSGEAFILKKLSQTGVQDIESLVDHTEKKGREFLITTIADGKPLNAREGQVLTKNRIVDILDKLTMLDQFGFIQYDTQIDNVLFSGDKAQLIDFGGCSFSVQTKRTFEKLRKSGMPMDFKIYYPTITDIDKEALSYFEVPQALHSTKPYLGLSDLDSNAITRSVNPHFSAFSNVTNFETRSLYYHLFDNTRTPNGTQNAQNIFKTYLNQRAEHYHKPMAEFFEGLDIDKVARACEVTNDKIACKIQNAADYERRMAGILSGENIPDNILKTELAKIQMRWVISESSSSSVAQYKKLKDMISDFRNEASGDMKQYFNDALAFFDILEKPAYERFNPTANQTLYPSRDLCNLLFNKNTVNETASNIASNASNSRNVNNVLSAAANNAKKSPTGVIIVGSIIALGALVGIVVKSKNKNTQVDLNNKQNPVNKDNFTLQYALKNNTVVYQKPKMPQSSMQTFINAVR